MNVKFITGGAFPPDVFVTDCPVKFPNPSKGKLPVNAVHLADPATARLPDDSLEADRIQDVYCGGLCCGAPHPIPAISRAVRYTLLRVPRRNTRSSYAPSPEAATSSATSAITSATSDPETPRRLNTQDGFARTLTNLTILGHLYFLTTRMGQLFVAAGHPVTIAWNRAGFAKRMTDPSRYPI